MDRAADRLAGVAGATAAGRSAGANHHFHSHAFAAYLPADQLGVSGVLAVVTAGLYLGWRAPEIINSRMRLQAGPVWEMIVFLLNGLVFILIGLQLPEVLQGHFGKAARFGPRLCWVCGCCISALVIVVRFIWVFAATYVPRWLSKKLRGTRSVIRLAAGDHRRVDGNARRGVAGGGIGAAVDDIKDARGLAMHLIIFFTFVVILVTLVLQGLSLPFLIRWLKVVDSGEAEHEEREARLKANQAALARLAELESEDTHSRRTCCNVFASNTKTALRQLEACDSRIRTGRSRFFPRTTRNCNGKHCAWSGRPFCNCAMNAHQRPRVATHPARPRPG